MARTLLVVPTAAGGGLARTSLALVRALDRKGVNVGFVKPVAQPRADGGVDRSTALAAVTSALRPPDPLSTAELERQLGAGGVDAVLEKIVAACQPVHERSDIVVVEGLSPSPSKLYASGLNQALAKALDADVILVGNWPVLDPGRGESPRDHRRTDRARPRRDGRRRIGRDARYHRQRVLVGRAGPRPRLRGQWPSGRGSVSDNTSGPSAGPARPAADRRGVASARVDLVAGP